MRFVRFVSCSDGSAVLIRAREVESVRESLVSTAHDPRVTIKCRSGENYYVRGTADDVLRQLKRR